MSVELEIPNEKDRCINEVRISGKKNQVPLHVEAAQLDELDHAVVANREIMQHKRALLEHRCEECIYALARVGVHLEVDVAKRYQHKRQPLT